MSDFASRISDCGVTAVGPWHGTAWFCLALSALISSGCGPRSEGVEVNGGVTYNGQPLTNAAITFFPVQGRPATAPLDATGQYLLELAPGEYQVTITVGADLPSGFQEGDPLPPPAIILPDRFTNRVHTELSATIAEDQSEPINFNLK